MIKILFLAANPINTSQLGLDVEVRSIDQKLRMSQYRDQFKLEQHWAVSINDVQEYLLRHSPQIVHFSGHGMKSGEIILQSQSGQSQPISPKSLSNLFSIFSGTVKCVVLNACYSKVQANAIAQHIDCVVGMTSSVTDDAAINFAGAFYQALAYGKSVKVAFDLGCNQIDLHDLGEENIPKLLSLRNDPVAIDFRDMLENNTEYEELLQKALPQLPDNLRALVEEGCTYIEIPDSLVRQRNFSFERSKKVYYELRMRETDTSFVFSTQSVMQIGVAAEYLVSELLPHLEYSWYEWTFVRETDELPPEHTFKTAGVRTGDRLYLHGNTKRPAWAPSH